MSLIALFGTLVVVGIVLYAINAYVPMDAKIKNILNVVAVIVVVLWLLSVFGVIGHLSAVKVPSLK